MDWKTIVISLLPLVKPALVSAIAAGAAFLGAKVLALIQHSHYSAFAGMVVSAIEDAETKMGGEAKLALAISKVTAKFGISEADAEDYVRAAYTNLIKPLDTLNTPLPAASTTSQPTPKS